MATVPRGEAAALCGPSSLPVRRQPCQAGGGREPPGLSACSAGYSLLCWDGESAWLLSLALGSAPSATLQQIHPFLPLPN